MKRTITCWLMAFIAIAMYAQKDVTTFLGIPIDGYKSEKLADWNCCNAKQ